MITQIGRQLPWFALNIETVLNLPFVLNYLADATLPEIIQFAYYLPVGEQFWAGYRALIIDLVPDSGFPVGRILLEPGTGIVLREQYYEPGSNRRTIIESTLKDLKFNQPMPTLWKRPDTAILSPRMFLPGNVTENAETSSWSSPEFPHSMTGSITPNNFDPSHAQLAFIKSNPFDAHEDGLEKYDIYADNFRLGEIDLADPLQMICTRSPSGKRIAFTDWTYFPDGEANRIYWFDLDDLQISSHQLPEIALHWIGFSPDSSLLGMSGFSEVDGRNNFILLDTQSGTSRMLPILTNFNRISWSPDGSRILVLEEIPSSFSPDTERTINVYSAVDGLLLDQIKVTGIFADSTSMRIPIDGWEAEFNLSIQDIASCATPPGN